MASPSPSPSWVILGRAPRVSAAAGAAPDVSLPLAEPPRVTQLTVAPTVFAADPDPQARITSPRVLAADPAAGLFLAVAPPSVSERPPTEARVYRGPDGVERTIHVGRIRDPAYFVLDVPSAAASRVPGPDFLNATSVGVVAAPAGRRGFMVAELQTMVGGRQATLICFSSETGEWIRTRVDNPRPGWIWTIDDVISHDGKLWWVDLSMGLLACDPFADQPDMAYVPLPNGGGHGGAHHGCSYCSQRRRASGRCVQVSSGKFRCVEMSCTSEGGAPELTMHTLADPETAEWTPEHRVSFAEIWADESYKAAGLPEKAPVIVLIHPKKPDIVYFFVKEKEYLFAVNMNTKKVVEGGASSWPYVLAWELPPALTADDDHGGQANGADNQHHEAHVHVPDNTGGTNAVVNPDIGQSSNTGFPADGLNEETGS